jgi:hypothetical protein
LEETIVRSIKSKTIVALLVLIFSAALAGCRATGAAPVVRNGVEPIFKFAEGLAIKGFDPVAYFIEGKAMEGQDEFAAEWAGARWRFASARHRQMFMAEPDKYAPQYGGYCSWAVGHGYTAKGDPEAWEIIDGKLYLNYNREVKTKWEQDAPALITKGDENWLAFQKTKPEHKGEGSN